MKLNRFKALFQVFLIVLMVFTVYSLPVEAANVCCEKTKAGEYCEYADESECLAQETIEGKTFVYGRAPTSCDQTSYCQLGCCFDKEGDGYCYANYPRARCEKQFEGKFSKDEDCIETPECKQGCCIIGTQAAFVTEVRCKSETANFPQLEMDFRPDLTTEAACLEEARTAEQGCCVSETGSCVFSSKAECNVPFGNQSGFFSGKFCSELGFCDCTPSNPVLGGKGILKDNTGCLGDRDDVYWFDSCENPEGVVGGQGDGAACRVETARVDCASGICENGRCKGGKGGGGDCDYSLGNLCGDSDGNRVFSCESLGCTKNDFLSINLEGYFDDADDVTEGGVDNGESWCLYDYDVVDEKAKVRSFVSDQLRDVGFASRDPVGSRHYRSVCINGKEFVEPCEDFRKEWCLQGSLESDGETWVGAKGEIFTEARCLENRWQSCIDECNSAEPGMSKDRFREAQENDKECCLDFSKRDCAWVSGKCVPKVSPGFKFWEDEGTNTCGKGSMECKFRVKCGGWSSLFGVCGDIGAAGGVREFFGAFAPFIGMEGWHPIDTKGNAISINDVPCFKYDFIQAANNLCRSFGDCGAHYNLEGEITYDGFYSPKQLSSEFKGMIGNRLEAKQIREDRDPDWDEGFEILDYRLRPEEYSKFKDVITAEGWRASSIVSGVISGITITSGLLGALEIWPAAVGESMLTAPGFFISKGITSFAYSAAKKAGEEAGKKAGEEAGKKAYEEALQKELGVATWAEWMSYYMWAKTVYDLVDVLGADTQIVTIKTECRPWVQPTRTDDCEKCNPDFYTDEKGNPTDVKAFKTCSEYRCKSYGATCDLINKGTGNETCVSLNPYDVISPVIKPWAEGFEEEYQKEIQETATGLKITKEIPIYETITVSIQTDEPSQCKMSFEHGKRYDEMEPFFFGGPNYRYFHTQAIFYPSSKNYTTEGMQLTTGGKYTVYVRCEDAVGNANENDYSMEFEVGAEPDLTPPVIEATDLIGKEKYLTAGANESTISLFVNEPARCRWSTSPLAFQDMNKDIECTTENVPTDPRGYKCVFDGEKKITNLDMKFGEVKFAYFKCEDLSPNKNFNKDPYSITLKGSDELVIKDVGPKGEVFTSAAQENVTLTVTTEKGAEGNGNAICRFTQQETLKDNVQAMEVFLNTNESTHEQPFVLSSGQHIFYVGCVDKAGNQAFSETTFSILADITAPVFNKIYWDEDLDVLAFEVGEDAECQYSVEGKFAFGEGSATVKDGIVHKASDKSSIYYILCKDVYGNVNEDVVEVRIV